MVAKTILRDCTIKEPKPLQQFFFANASSLEKHGKKINLNFFLAYGLAQHFRHYLRLAN